MAERNGRSRLMVGEAPSPSQAATSEQIQVVDEVLQGFVPFERTQLLPLLLALQARSASLSKGLLGYLSARTRVPFAELHGVASFYALLDTDGTGVTIRVCNGVPCILAGAEQLEAVLRQSTLEWEWFPCIGQCDRAPAALVGDQPLYGVTPEALGALASRTGRADV